MRFKSFKQLCDGYIRLEIQHVIGLGDGAPGRTMIWMQGREQPFEVEGLPEDLQRVIEQDRGDVV